ncbi:MAG: GIY-YIG nuclease family protein [Dehalococcoidia bacterium]
MWRRETHWVYVLRSSKDGRLYTGVSSDLSRRLREHNGGKVRSTRSRRRLTLEYSEASESRHDALEREAYFKTAAGGVLKQRLAGPKRESAS